MSRKNCRLSFSDIGHHAVKNIAKPVHVYRVDVRKADQNLLSVTSVERVPPAGWRRA